LEASSTKAVSLASDPLGSLCIFHHLLCSGRVAFGRSEGVLCGSRRQAGRAAGLGGCLSGVVRRRLGGISRHARANQRAGRLLNRSYASTMSSSAKRWDDRFQEKGPIVTSPRLLSQRDSA
jgi:hypothetical protein